MIKTKMKLDNDPKDSGFPNVACGPLRDALVNNGYELRSVTSEFGFGGGTGQAIEIWANPSVGLAVTVKLDFNGIITAGVNLMQNAAPVIPPMKVLSDGQVLGQFLHEFSNMGK